jgi:thioredoxin-related protein
MKNLIISCIVFLITGSVNAQDLTKFKLYKPAENAEQAIAAAVQEAKEKGKHVFIQIGGNWCIWCARFNNFVESDTAIKEYVDNNYVTYHLNYSPENKNANLLAKYGFPQRFGFPVFLILNEKGQLIHTQNSAYLEEEKGYGKLKVVEFFKSWTKSALDPAYYKD